MVMSRASAPGAASPPQRAATGRRRVQPLAAARMVVFVLVSLPAAALLWGLFTGGLGVNPVETITKQTGIWTLRLVVATLAVTPLRWATGWNGAIRLRRMLGLFAFFYGTLHFSTYLVLDQFFALDLIVKDVKERPFITAGFTAFVLMIPLALTSTAGMIRRLGGRTWNRLHRLVYVTAVCGVLHYAWLAKVEIPAPFVYGAIVAGLLGIRVWRWSRRSRVVSARSMTPVTDQ